LNGIESLHLHSETHSTISFKDCQKNKKVLKQQKATKAMKKLRGSGNGNLVTALLKEREKDALL